jgi:hypothetical protein
MLNEKYSSNKTVRNNCSNILDVLHINLIRYRHNFDVLNIEIMRQKSKWSNKQN